MPEEKLLREERYVTGVCVLTMVVVGGAIMTVVARPGGSAVVLGGSDTDDGSGW